MKAARLAGFAEESLQRQSKKCFPSNLRRADVKARQSDRDSVQYTLALRRLCNCDKKSLGY